MRDNKTQQKMRKTRNNAWKARDNEPQRKTRNNAWKARDNEPQRKVRNNETQHVQRETRRPTEQAHAPLDSCKQGREGRGKRDGRRENRSRFALQLAETLGETVGAKGWRQIVHTATVCGEAALRLAAEETLRLIDAGGLPTMDGTRKRTPGGVLLRLVREAVTPDAAVRIFGWRARVHVYQSSQEFREQFARLAADYQEKRTKRSAKRHEDQAKDGVRDGICGESVDYR